MEGLGNKNGRGVLDRGWMCGVRCRYVGGRKVSTFSMDIIRDILHGKQF